MLTSVGFVMHGLLPRDIQAPALVEPFDVDGDGDTDLLVLENDALVWFPNTDGLGSFGPREILTDVVNGGALDLADLDGDNLTDIVLATRWLKNLGSGDYVTLQYESFDVQDEYGDVPPHRIVAADVDGDADLDLVRMDHIGFLAFGISWAENDDGRIQGRERAPCCLGVWDITAADVNGDGIQDIINTGSPMAWLAGSASGSPLSTKHETDVDTHYSHLIPFDWDTDGDTDLLFLDELGSIRHIGWLENNGLGEFESAEILAFEPFQYNNHELTLADIDGDGDQDFLLGGEDPWVRRQGVVWIENVAGEFDAEQTHTVASEESGQSRPVVSDIDGDGALDVISVVDGDQAKIVWQKNDDGKGNFGEPQVIHEYPAKTRINRAGLSDVDNDGLLDVVTKSSSIGQSLGWIQPAESGVFGGLQPRETDDGLPFPNDHVYVDMDGDGDQDIVSRVGGRHWYERKNSSYEERTIDGNFAGAYDVADIDGDGDPDLIGMTPFSADDLTGVAVAWGENTEGNISFASDQGLAYFDHSGQVFPLDADLDGDIDIVSFSGNLTGNHSAWYENLGGGVFAEVARNPDFFDGVVSLHRTDGDGDGFLDRITAVSADAILWERDSTGVVAAELGSHVDYRRYRDRVGVDLDGDGDTDFVGFGQWQENVDGQLSDITEHPRLSNWGSTLFADVDRDGFLDIMTAQDGKVAWYENRLLGDTNDNGEVDFADFLALSANFGATDAVWEDGDFNSDGKVSFLDFLTLSANFGNRRV